VLLAAICASAPDLILVISSRALCIAGDSVARTLSIVANISICL